MQGACGIGGLLAVNVDGAPYVPVYDDGGDVLGYVAAAGNLAASFQYAPFGAVLASSGDAVRFRHRYSTKYFDEETGLYDFGKRFYSPSLGRWINRDPLEEDGGIHLYRYVSNSPVTKVDPDGCIPLDTLWDLGNIVFDVVVGDDVALAADTAALMVPYVPAGTSKLVKAARLHDVGRVCPAAKHVTVSYKYVSSREYGRHFLRVGASREYPNTHTPVFCYTSTVIMSAIFFDMDGTLFDSRADLGAAVNFTRAALGLSPISQEEAVSYVGNGARYLLEHAIPEMTGRFDEIWPLYTEQYRAHMLDATELYSGVRTTLAELHDRGWKMGVSTNKPNFAARAILEHFGLARYFGAAVVAGGDCPEMKPSAMPLRQAAAQMGGHRLSSHDWMVGDNWTDMESGANAGVKTAFCTFGFGRLKESRHTMKINRFDELLRFCKAED